MPRIATTMIITQFKDVPEKLIDRCMDEIDEEDYHKTIKKLYESYFSGLKNLKNYQKTMKSIRYLIGKGFEYDIIKEVIEE